MYILINTVYFVCASYYIIGIHLIILTFIYTVFMISRNIQFAASLVAQWLRIRLKMQGTQVRSLVREDPICRGATKPMRHNYLACTLELTSHNY